MMFTDGWSLGNGDDERWWWWWRTFGFFLTLLKSCEEAHVDKRNKVRAPGEQGLLVVSFNKLVYG